MSTVRYTDSVEHVIPYDVPSVGTTRLGENGSFAIDGDWIIAGAPTDTQLSNNANEQGALFFFKKETSGWTVKQAIGPPQEQVGVRNFAKSVDINGDKAIVSIRSAYKSDIGKSTGAVIFYKLDNNGVWQPDPSGVRYPVKTPGVFETESIYFGQSVAIKGNYAVVGCNASDDNTQNSGHAFVYEYVNNVWTERNKLKSEVANYYLGWSVDVDYDGTVIVGSPFGSYNSNETSRGYIAVYNKNNDNTWGIPTSNHWYEPHYLLRVSTQEAAQNAWRMGEIIAISNRAIVGGIKNVDTTDAPGGKVCLFKKNGDNSWGNLITGNVYGPTQSLSFSDPNNEWDNEYNMGKGVDISGTIVVASGGVNGNLQKNGSINPGGGVVVFDLGTNNLWEEVQVIEPLNNSYVERQKTDTYGVKTDGTHIITATNSNVSPWNYSTTDTGHISIYETDNGFQVSSFIATDNFMNKILLICNKRLKNQTLDISNFNVLVNNVTTDISSVSIDTNLVIVELKTALFKDYDISINYTKGSDNTANILDENDVALDSFTYISVKNDITLVDSVSPSLTEVNSIEESEPNKLILQFSESILTDFTSGELTDFTVNVAGTNNPVTNYSITGSSLTLTLTNRVYKDQEVTIAYNKNTFNIKDVVGNESSSSISTTTVTNNTTAIYRILTLNLEAIASTSSTVDLSWNDTLQDVSGYILEKSLNNDTYTFDSLIDIHTIKVKVVSGTRRNGSTGNIYTFDDKEVPTLRLIKGKTYKFDQSDSSNDSHLIKFVTESNLGTTTYYTSGVTESGTAGSNGIVTFVVPMDAPDLHYRCVNHDYMGSGPNFGGIKMIGGTVDETINITVTVVNSGGNKFALDGVTQDTLTLVKGKKYRFDTSDSSLSGHPFALHDRVDGGGVTKPSSAIESYVNVSLEASGSPNAYVEINVSASIIYTTIYYYCAAHSGMGGDLNIVLPPTGNTTIEGLTANSLQFFKMKKKNPTGLYSSDIFALNTIATQMPTFTIGVEEKSYGSVDISWNSIPNATITLDISNNGSSFQDIAGADNLTGTVYTKEGLTVGSDVQFRGNAKNITDVEYFSGDANSGTAKATHPTPVSFGTSEQVQAPLVEFTGPVGNATYIYKSIDYTQYNNFNTGQNYAANEGGLFKANFRTDYDKQQAFIYAGNMTLLYNDKIYSFGGRNFATHGGYHNVVNLDGADINAKGIATVGSFDKAGSYHPYYYNFTDNSWYSLRGESSYANAVKNILEDGGWANGGYVGEPFVTQTPPTYTDAFHNSNLDAKKELAINKIHKMNAPMMRITEQDDVFYTFGGLRSTRRSGTSLSTNGGTGIIINTDGTSTTHIGYTRFLNDTSREIKNYDPRGGGFWAINQLTALNMTTKVHSIITNASGSADPLGRWGHSFVSWNDSGTKKFVLFGGRNIAPQHSFAKEKIDTYINSSYYDGEYNWDSANNQPDYQGTLQENMDKKTIGSLYTGILNGTEITWTKQTLKKPDNTNMPDLPNSDTDHEFCRWGHSTQLYGNKLYIIGGWTRDFAHSDPSGIKFTNDIHYIDLSTMKWSNKVGEIVHYDYTSYFTCQQNTAIYNDKLWVVIDTKAYVFDLTAQTSGTNNDEHDKVVISLDPSQNVSYNSIHIYNDTLYLFNKLYRTSKGHIWPDGDEDKYNNKHDGYGIPTENDFLKDNELAENYSVTTIGLVDIGLKWPSLNNISGNYTLSRSDDGGSNFTELSTNATSPYSIASLPSSNTKYKIKAQVNNVISNVDTTSVITTTDPDLKYDSNVDVSANGFGVKFNSLSNHYGYVIERSTDNSNFEPAVIIPGRDVVITKGQSVNIALFNGELVNNPSANRTGHQYDLDDLSGVDMILVRGKSYRFDVTNPGIGYGLEASHPSWAVGFIHDPANVDTHESGGVGNSTEGWTDGNYWGTNPSGKTYHTDWFFTFNHSANPHSFTVENGKKYYNFTVASNAPDKLWWRTMRSYNSHWAHLNYNIYIVDSINSAVLRNLLPAKNYFYRIRNRKPAPTATPYYELTAFLGIDSKSTQAVGGIDKFKITDITDTTIDISWNNLDGMKGIKIDISNNGASFTNVAPSVSGTSYQITGLTKDDNHQLKITSTFGGNISFSPEVISSMTPFAGTKSWSYDVDEYSGTASTFSKPYAMANGFAFYGDNKWWFIGSAWNMYPLMFSYDFDKTPDTHDRFGLRTGQTTFGQHMFEFTDTTQMGFSQGNATDARDSLRIGMGTLITRVIDPTQDSTKLYGGNAIYYIGNDDSSLSGSSNDHPKLYKLTLPWERSENNNYLRVSSYTSYQQFALDTRMWPRKNLENGKFTGSIMFSYNNKLYIHGGMTYYNNKWVLLIHSTKSAFAQYTLERTSEFGGHPGPTFSCLEPTNTGPLGLCGHSYAIKDDNLYVVGGVRMAHNSTNQGGASATMALAPKNNSIWRYNFTNNTWTELIPTNGTIPDVLRITPRVSIDGDIIYVYGGSKFLSTSQSMPYNADITDNTKESDYITDRNLYGYNIVENSWKQVTTTNDTNGWGENSSNIETGRRGISFIHNNKFYIYGGIMKPDGYGIRIGQTLKNINITNSTSLKWPAVIDLSGNYNVDISSDGGNTYTDTIHSTSETIANVSKVGTFQISAELQSSVSDTPYTSGIVKSAKPHTAQIFHETFETNFYEGTQTHPTFDTLASPYGGLYSIKGVTNSNDSVTWRQSTSDNTLPTGIKAISFWYYYKLDTSYSESRDITINSQDFLANVSPTQKLFYNAQAVKYIEKWGVPPGWDPTQSWSFKYSVFINGEYGYQTNTDNVYLNMPTSAPGWHHIYIDMKQTNPTTGFPVNDAAITQLDWLGVVDGTSETTKRSSDSIDDVRFFNKHLTLKEIKNLYQGGTGNLDITGDFKLEGFEPLTNANNKRIDISLNKDIGVSVNFNVIKIRQNFTIKVNGTALSVAYGLDPDVTDISCNGKILMLTLKNSILKDDVVTVSYTKNTTESYRNIIDSGNNELANISETTLTNNITIGAPLPPTSITVTSPWDPISTYHLDFGIKFNESTAIGNDNNTYVEYNIEYSLDGTTDWQSIPGGASSPYYYNVWEQGSDYPKGFRWTENNIPNSLKNSQSGKPIPGKIVWIRVRAGATFQGQLLWGNYTTFSTYLGIGVMRIGESLNVQTFPADKKIRVVLEDSDINYQYVEKYSIIPIEDGTIRLDLSKNVSPQTNIPREVNNKVNEPLYKLDTGVEITGLTNNQPYHFKIITKMRSQTLNPITITDFTQTSSGKTASWSSITDANYKIERSDDGGSTYTIKKTSHNNNSYLLESEPTVDTKIKVTATITPQKEFTTDESTSPVPPASAPNDFQVTTGEQDPTDTGSATRNPDHVYKFIFTKYQWFHKYDIEMSTDNINYTRVIETDPIYYNPNATAGPMGGSPGPEANEQFTYYLHPGITGYDMRLQEPGRTIWFRIKAAKEINGSYTYGAPSTTAIYNTVPLEKPTLLSTELGNTQVTLTIEDTGGVVVSADISGGTYTTFTNLSPDIGSGPPGGGPINYEITSLTKGTDYEVHLKTLVKSNEYGLNMKPFIDTTKLYWPDIGSEYKVLRQVGGIGNLIEVVKDITTTEYSLSNLSPAYDPVDTFLINYTQYVESDYATTGVITTLNAAEPPTNMTFTNVTPNSIKINWVKPTTGANPVKYKIRVSTDNVTYTTLSDNVQPTGDNNSYTHNDLVPGTSYYYKVHSIGAPPNDQDSFPLSGNTNTTLQTPILIGIKTYNIDTSGNAIAIANSGRVDISWNAVPSANEYHVFEKIGGGGYSIKQITSNTYVTFKINHEITYKYQIKAKKGSVFSEHVETSGVSQEGPPPYVNPNIQNEKTNINNAAKNGKVKLNWDIVGTQSSEEKQEIQRKIRGTDTWVTIATNVSKDLRNFKVKRLKNNVTYDFRVRNIHPTKGSIYTDLEDIKVEPEKVKNTFKSILNVDQNDNLPVDVSNAIQDLTNAQNEVDIINKITPEGNLPREAIETVLKEQQKILNSTLADTGEKKRKLRTETMNMLFSIDENLKTIELTKEDLGLENEPDFDSSKIKKTKIIAIKPDMNKESTDITLDLQVFDNTDITQGFYLPMDEEDIANLKFANGNVVKFEKGSEDDNNTKNKTFIIDLVGTSTITSTRDGFSMTSPDNYALANDVVTVNGVEILVGSLYDGRAVPVEEDTSVEKRGYFKHPNSMLNQYHYKMSSIRKLDSLTRSNTGMNFILRNSTHTSPYKKWANPTPNNNGSMGRLERLKALHQNAKSHPNDK